MSEKITVVRTEDLSVRLNGSNTVIVYGTLEIHSGDFVLVRGYNGSGKSTFLKLFKPNLHPYFSCETGKLFYPDGAAAQKSVFDYSPRELAWLNRQIVDVGQEEIFTSWASAYDVLTQPALRAVRNDALLTPSKKQEKKRWIKEKASWYFETYLEKSFFDRMRPQNWLDFKCKSAERWSGGQKKMLHLLAGLLKAEAVGAKLILMDEPLNNLDAHNKWLLNRALIRLRSQSDVAVIMITHCQIFEGINKTITLEENDGRRSARLDSISIEPHRECLEGYRERVEK